MNTEESRALGRLEGKVEALTSKVNGMDAKLDAALAHINKQRGAAFVTHSIVAAVVAFLTSWITK